MTDVLIDLEALAPNIAAAVEARRLGNSVGRASQRLADAPRQAARFGALIDAALALEALADANARRSLQQAVGEAEDIGEGLETASTAEDLQYVSEDFPKFTGALGSLDNVLRQLWRQTVQSEFQSLISVGRVLGHIPKTLDLGARLQQVGHEAEALAERPPLAEQFAPEIARLRQSRAALDAELHQVTDNEEVDAFLAAVTRDAATLAHVTGSVFEWLKRYGALEAFSVRGGR